MSVEIQVQFDRFNLFGGGSTAVTEMTDKALQFALNSAAADIADIARASVATAYPPASDPGEPPHKRTGELQAGIKAIPNSAKGEALVVSEAPYSTDLEFGTAHIAARPFMTPAVEQVTHRNGVAATVTTVFSE